MRTIKEPKAREAAMLSAIELLTNYEQTRLATLTSLAKLLGKADAATILAAAPEQGQKPDTKPAAARVTQPAKGQGQATGLGQRLTDLFERKNKK
jgi:ferritin-like metal-binding protein YciE